jgi:TP901 family phage tail tape measure protein
VPLGSRDVLLAIRAQDLASRTIRQVGTSFDVLAGQAEAAAMQTVAGGAALLGVGTAIAGVGAVGLATLYKFTQQAIDYNREVGLTATQVDQAGVSLQTLGQIGLDVASKTGAPLDQMQSALYDIFSSMNVTVPQSQTLLEGFSRAAVAGQVDVQTAGRATIAVMNAWGLGTDDLGKVLDTQFQLVRKGVGTYDEFATSLGRAIPSARRAGQSFESLAGMMAFLTRNGLSTDQAATSAARALDTLSNSKVAGRLKDMGISVVDASGNFRDMSGIATDLGKKLDGLTDEKKAAALENLFKGAGNSIQARRFWDLAIRNFGQLNDLTGDMVNSSGALQGAYDIMFNQPATQAQLFKNNVDALKIGLGEALIPIFAQLVSWGNKVVGMFNSLSPKTKELIARILAFSAAGMVLVGTLLIITGAFKVLQGTIQLAGGLTKLFEMDPVTLLALAALAGLAYLVYQNWDTIVAWWTKNFPQIKSSAIDTWNAVRDKTIEVWDQYILPKIQEIKDWFDRNWPTIWENVKNDVGTAWQWIQDNVIPVVQDLWDKMQQFASWVSENWPKWRDDIVNAAITVWLWMLVAWDIIQKVWDKLTEFYNWVVNTFGPGFINLWNTVRDNVMPILTTLWTFIQDFLFPVLLALLALTVTITQGMQKAWHLFGDDITNYLTGWWNGITQQFGGMFDVLVGLMMIFVGVFTGNWSLAWEGVKKVAEGVWQGMQGSWDLFLANLQLAWAAFQIVFEPLWNAAWSGFSSTFHFFVDPLVDGLNAIIGALRTIIDLAGQAIDKVKSVATGGGGGGLGGVLGAVSAVANPGLAAGNAISNFVFGPTGMGLDAGRVIHRNEFGRELFVPASRGTLLSAADTKRALSGNGGGVTVSEGAVQVTLTGPVDSSVMPDLDRVMNNAVRALAKEIRRQS